VKRELRAFDGSLGPEVKYEVFRIGKAPKEKDRHYIEFLGSCAPLDEERSLLSPLCVSVYGWCLSVGGGCPIAI
jgi:hypothetical protein